MPLTVPMSCGFDADSLMDFDCGPASAGVCWPTSGADFDADPLLMVSLQSGDKGDDQSGTGLLKDAAFNGETDASSGGWCARSKSSTGGSNSSPSSYCRRLGSSQRARSGSSFQLWSPRLKQRDERKRVLKMSLAKLRRIDDAESCLRRSVLLNNTLRRLQREVRDEKANAMDRLQQQHHHQQQQWHHQQQQQQQQQPQQPPPEADYVVVDSRLEHPAAPVRLDPIAKSLLSCDELPSLSEEMDDDENSLSTTATTPKPAAIKRRRSASSEDDDVTALSLNELYLPPPTPRLISSLDAADDDVVDVVSEDALDAWSSSSYKKAKLADHHHATEVGAISDVAAPRPRPALRPCNGLPASPVQQQAPAPYSSANQNATPTLVSGYASSSSSSSPPPQTPYSCGQSSLFGELQSVVFHSLITSLES